MQEVSTQNLYHRSGQEFPYREMVKEWNGSLVHISEFEAKHPQLDPKPHMADPEALYNARIQRVAPVVVYLDPHIGQVNLHLMVCNHLLIH